MKNLKGSKGFETLARFLVVNGVSFEFFGPGREDDLPYIRIYGCHYNRLRHSRSQWCFPGDLLWIDITSDVDVENKYDVTIHREPREYERRMGSTTTERRLITIPTVIKICKEEFCIWES